MRSIDLHSHILPGVDDGPETIEGSLELARAAVAAGTELMVATPHVNESRFIAPADIPAAVAALARELDAAGIDLEVRPGGEIALPRLADLSEPELDGLGLGGGPYLLLETPFHSAAGEIEPAVLGALDRGRDVLLAHPERSAAFQREPARLARLVEAGVLVQVTAGALDGAFGPRARRAAVGFLREELVHVVASDAHNDDRRPPGAIAALAAIEDAVPGIEARAEWLCRDVPAAILAGDPIPEPAPLAPARGGAWRRLAGATRR